MDEAQRIERARKSFKDFKATLIEDTQRLTAIEWRNKDGSSNYYIDFMVDKEHGRLHISGDLGYCIADWYSPNDIINLSCYVRDICYFIEKMQATSDKYDIDAEEVKSDIESSLRELLEEDASEEEKEQFEEDLETIKDHIDDCYISRTEGFIPDDTVRDLLDKYDPEWWEHGYGEKISNRVYLWSVGLNMAVDQLLKEGKLQKAA